mmetsp:Transcript_28292/g.71799  ORF Transcript_28292/g.71799 Transcript_28292/m.71799 type:complete len:208 (+) Transcript_28292:113-736(+)|eukprot:CAMPEP_0178998742 /NCGR_PEP_ID=MMETSP0795-20121207/9673_1 /TAXON_ID=88552 /ORGANISM="Amoebophrya sp., Strain Ameob2" /LENGTH=207 /DNA_ID=CAMNT_0020691437 /DNA_START=64 /DNA_END=687 /DNA_ORIENTATION=-
MFGPRRDAPTGASISSSAFLQQKSNPHNNSMPSFSTKPGGSGFKYPVQMGLTGDHRVKSRHAETERKRIPLCFRSHRDLAGAFEHNAELFEPRVNVRNEGDMFWDESLQDNVEMWFPLDQRPQWVKSKAYQRRQLMGIRRQKEEIDFTHTLENVRAQAAAGSVLAGGKYPNSFDFSGGKCLQDRFYTRENYLSTDGSIPGSGPGSVK